ncbi:hypothetical protein Tco_0176789, partial [Tanacetum coccineum]
KDKREVSTLSTARAKLSTGKNGVNTASRSISTVAVNTASEIDTTAAEKAIEKGKGIITEPEPPKKLKKRVQLQLSVDEELARKIYKEDQARVIAEQEQKRINFEAALELQRQLDERQEVPAQTQEIDWNDPSVLRYHALKNRPVLVWDQVKTFVPMGSEIEKESEVEKESSIPVE